jgi:hypothetical protein
MQKQVTTMLRVAAVLLAAHAIEAVAQGAADRAAAVLAQARQALGGEERLRQVSRLQAAGDFRRVLGEMQMEGELELLLEAPDKLRRNEEIAMPGGATMTRTEVVNGTEVWDDSGQRGGMGHGVAMIMRGPGGAALDPEGVKEMQRRMRRAELRRYAAAWLLAAEGTVVHAGIAEAPDGKADVIEIAPGDGAPMRLFIDQETHLPLMITWRGPQPRMMVRRGGGPPPGRDDAAREAAQAGPPTEVTFEMRLAEYREVDGVMLPHRITRAIDGQPNEEWTIASYKVNPSFKSNTFTR